MFYNWFFCLDYLFLKMKTWALCSGIVFLKKKNQHFRYNFEYLLFVTPCTGSFIEIVFNLHNMNAFIFFKYLPTAYYVPGSEDKSGNVTL